MAISKAGLYDLRVNYPAARCLPELTTAWPHVTRNMRIFAYGYLHIDVSAAKF